MALWTGFNRPSQRSLRNIPRLTTQRRVGDRLSRRFTASIMPFQSAAQVFFGLFNPGQRLGAPLGARLHRVF